MIKRDEIIDYVTYKEQREVERPKIIQIKKKRRVHLGSYLTFLFENRDTIRYQIQEMTLAEKIVKDAEIQYEIDTYNQLFGVKGSLPCVLLVEIEDPEVRLVKLSEWYDLPKTLYVKTVNGDKVYAVYDKKQMSESKLSSVQYLYFNTKGENVIAVGTDYPDLKEEVELSDIQKTALNEDIKDLSK